MPYLSYNDEYLPAAMRSHREVAKRCHADVVAVFRETVLPCRPVDPRYFQASETPSASGGGGGGDGKFAGASRASSGSGATPSRSGSRARTAGVSGAGTDLGGWGARSVEELQAAGLVQIVRRRGLEGEAKGMTMVRR